MKMPSHVKVGPHRYQIRIGSGVLDGADRYGQTRHDALTIDVAGEQVPAMMADTVLHETLHACLLGLALPDAKEERIVRFLTPVLLGVLRDNPKLVGWLCS